MSPGRSGSIAAFALSCLWAGAAHAQSSSTCSFDPAAATVTVTVDGNLARLAANRVTGEILLNGAPCAGATVLNTDSIQVSGGTQSDTVSLTGRLEPGLTPEAGGDSEIELSFALGPNLDHVIVNLRDGNDRLTFTSDGIDVRNDGDRDIFTGGTEHIRVNAGGGDDRIDASAYDSIVPPPSGTVIHLYGGSGDDILTGSTTIVSWLHGEDGADTLNGGDSNDQLCGGMGDDRMFGRGGNDRFLHDVAIADGADDMRGGDGIDELLYGGGPGESRVNGVTVTIGDAQPDGEPGEGDMVRGDIENVAGGAGPDVLVGNDVRNILSGYTGDDEVYGGGGDDVLRGFAGNDILVGDDGNDLLSGDSGDDFLGGGRGADELFGEGGRDELHGGGGEDILDGGDGRDEYFGDPGNDLIRNADAFAENVDCGEGATDDAEADPLDTFVGCEL